VGCEEWNGSVKGDAGRKCEKGCGGE